MPSENLRLDCKTRVNLNPPELPMANADGDTASPTHQFIIRQSRKTGVIKIVLARGVVVAFFIED
jgi:hypothetical protein